MLRHIPFNSTLLPMMIATTIYLVGHQRYLRQGMRVIGNTFDSLRPHGISAETTMSVVFLIGALTVTTLLVSPCRANAKPVDVKSVVFKHTCGSN